MNAKVTVVFMLPNMCGPEDLEFEGKTFDEMIRYLILEEGLFGLQDSYEITEIVEYGHVDM